MTWLEIQNGPCEFEMLSYILLLAATISGDSLLSNPTCETIELLPTHPLVGQELALGIYFW
jgi:hypothetical protein